MLNKEYFIIAKILKNYIDSLKRTVADKIDKECQHYSGFNDSLTNQRILDNIKRLEYLLWELNIDTDINNRTIREEEQKLINDYLDNIKKIKNEFVNTLIPQLYQGKSDYHLNFRIAGKLADILEQLLIASYMDGLNTRLLIDTIDKDGEIESSYKERERKRIDNKIEESYNRGSMILALCMAAAINGNKVAEDILNKK